MVGQGKGVDMKPYLVFGGMSYYPNGGWDDYLKAFDDYDKAVAYAIAYAIARELEWVHVVNVVTKGIVFNQGYKYVTDTDRTQL